MPDSAAPKFTAAQAAVVRQAAPWFGAMQMSFLLAEPAALVVPVTRRLLGRSGVQTGPVVLPMLNTVVVALVRRLQRSGRLSDQQHEAVGWAMIGWVGGTPFLAALHRRTVVLTARSPLWGYPMTQAVHVTALLVWMVTVLRRIKQQQRHDAAGKPAEAPSPKA